MAGKTNPPVMIEVQPLPTTEQAEEVVNRFQAELVVPAIPTITSAALFEQAGLALKATKGEQARLAAEKDALLEPLNTVVKRIRALFKPAEDRLADHEAALKERILAWNREVERQRREAQARLDQEAREAEERARKRARKLEAEGKEEQAEAVLANVAPAAIAVMDTPKVSGIATSTTWKAEVQSMLLLLDWCLKTDQLEQFFEVNQKALDAYARSFKDKAKIPGVKFTSESFIRSGRS